jgi:hypothetical protein
MHCSRKDIIRWNKQKKLKKQSQNADNIRKIAPIVKPAKIKQKGLRVIKKNGDIIYIE